MDDVVETNLGISSPLASSLRFIAIGLTLAILAACTSTTAPTADSSPPPRASCGAVSDLVVVPPGDNAFSGYALARAGPVWFSAFGPVRAGKAVMDFSPGYPTKIVIHPDAHPHPQVQLRGMECANGKPIHFCYNQGSCGFSGQPVSESELERRGDPAVTLAKDQTDDDTGYVLFPRRGTYMVSVEQGNRVLGSVVFQVG